MLDRFCTKDRLLEESKCGKLAIGINVYLRNKYTTKLLSTTFSDSVKGEKCNKCVYGVGKEDCCEAVNVLAVTIIKTASMMNDLHLAELYITAYDLEYDEFMDMILQNRSLVKLLLYIQLDSVYVRTAEDRYIHYTKSDLERILEV